MSTVYLITGANRGIGYQTAKKLSEDKSNLVIATARDPAKATQLTDLKRDNIKVIKLDVDSPLDVIKKDVEVLDKIAPNGVDVVLQNAGVLFQYEGDTATISLDSYTKHFETNTLGAIKVYQASFPYWSKKHDGVTKKFLFVSSIAGQLNDNQLVAYGYGLSKAALNQFATNVAVENKRSDNPTLNSSVVAPIHPGVVSTDMGIPVIDGYGLSALAITPEESGDFLAKLLVNVTAEDNGKFLNYDGKVLDW